jgi:hypothetical protein
MKKNMGNFDRGMRVVAALIFAYLFFTDAVSGFLGNTLLVFGAITKCPSQNQSQKC